MNALTPRPRPATVLPRRTLLQLAGALGLGAAALASTGCESAVGRQQGAAAAGAAPQPGGTLVAGISTDLIPGNLLTNSNNAITTVVGLVFDSLIRYPNDQVTPTPRLATSWKLAEDGRSLTLELRDDVTFHSGRPFTSQDVEFSIRTYGDAAWTAQLRRTAEAITRVDTSKPHQVTLEFSHPLGNIFDLLDTVPILDSASIDDLRTGRRIVGTGPFVLDAWVPNTSLTFTRNPDYWIPERPYLDRVEVQVITDAKALLSAIRSGQIQYAFGLGPLDLENLSQSENFVTQRLTGAEQQLYVGSNVTATPLDDVRLRRAIAYALDRTRVVEEVLRGSGYPISLPWPTYSPAFDEAANATYALDVERAKALVAEVGEIAELPLTYNPTPIQTSVAAIVQANLAAVGIRVRLDPLDQAQFVKLLIGAQFEGLWLATHSWAQYTPSTLTVSAYPFNAQKNASHYLDQGYADHANAAWKVADGVSPEAVRTYRAVSKDLLDAAFLAEIAVLFPQWVSTSRLQGVGYTKRSELQLTDAWLAGDR